MSTLYKIEIFACARFCKILL